MEKSVGGVGLSFFQLFKKSAQRGIKSEVNYVSWIKRNKSRKIIIYLWGDIFILFAWIYISWKSDKVARKSGNIQNLWSFVKHATIIASSICCVQYFFHGLSSHIRCVIHHIIKPHAKTTTYQRHPKIPKIYYTRMWNENFKIQTLSQPRKTLIAINQSKGKTTEIDTSNKKTKKKKHFENINFLENKLSLKRL